MLIAIVLLFLHALNSGTGATPVSPFLSPLNDPLLQPRQVPDPSSVCACPDKRSVLGIVWSCLGTLFICTWVSVHPNIPGLQESKWVIMRRRLKVMMWAFIAPELIVIWAYRQRCMAKKTSDKYQGRGWTITHGFFVVMGGLHLKDGDSALGVLSADHFHDLLQSDEIEFPTHITREDIEDKGKADGLTKGIAILQTTWFLAQCVARGVQKLPLTELEVVTLALATLNGLIYVLWWNKPLDVQRPLFIHLKVSSPPTSETPAGNLHTEDVIALRDTLVPNELDMEERRDAVPGRTLVDTSDDHATQSSPQAHEVARHPARREPLLSRAYNSLSIWASNVLNEFTQYTRDDSRRQELRKEDMTPARFLLHRVLADIFLIPALELFECDSPIEQGSDRVPTFYKGGKSEDIDRQILAMTVAGLAISTTFGGIHCIALAFPFPTEVQRNRWLAMSLTLIISPLMGPAAVIWYNVGSGDSVYVWIVRMRRHGGFPATISWGTEKLLYVIVVIHIFAMQALYIVARLGLLGQAMALLRKLPPYALADVDWANFVPHL